MHNFTPFLLLHQEFQSSNQLFIFRIRQAIHWFVTKKLFDNFIMFVILISSISLASEDPVDEDSPRNWYLGIADYFFTAIFTFEVCLKVSFNFKNL